MTARHVHRRAAAGLTLLTLAASLSGCAAEATTQAGAASHSPGPAQSSSPAQNPAPSAASSTPQGSGWTALQDSGAFKALTPQQQSKIGALEAMDGATFERQARDDQLAYGAFLREVYQDYAIAGTAAIAPDSQLPAAKKVSSTSSGAEIMDDEWLKAATARWSVQPDPGFASAAPAAPVSNYTKMAPSRVSPQFPAAYAEVSQPSEVTRAAVLAALPDSKGQVVVDESNSFIPFDGTWEQLPFKIVQVQNSGTRDLSQLYFAYTPFTNIHGAADGVWILMFNAQESQEKWIPDLSVID
ncbi:hypothetical protein [Arthrobacter sp.]|uniref:hypothetical protein n=1 Tax=Arthrobacter sp. TaxID=1667 RepID=UPI003394D4A7